MRLRSALLLLTGLFVPLSRAQTSTDGRAAAAVARAAETAVLRAVRIPSAPRVDGRLDEAGWADAPAIEGLTQRDPYEGAPASQRTVVRLVYDEGALYVGARMFDTAADSIMAPLARRDGDVVADGFAIFLDPTLDRRTGYYFAVSASGTQYDGTLSNDTWDSSDWDGVWTSAVVRDADGWTAELRIPYSQLRFGRADVQTWGVNFKREMPRRQENAFLVHVPKGEPVFVSRFRSLTGIAGVRPGLGLEVTPYVTTQARFSEAPRGDPFHDGSELRADVGGDLRARLGGGLSLAATVNPDFGQVEVDPAVVNLSDRETFFPEKRPFFVEGSSVFDFGQGGTSSNYGFNWGNPDFFYTRRVGRTPQGTADFGYAYRDRPESVAILGAAKVTGSIGGTNVGLVQSVTGRGVSDVRSETGERGRVEVEPLASYTVARVQRGFADGRYGLGVLGTSTLRGFRDEGLRERVNEGAFTGGVDGWARLGRAQTWALAGWLGASRVTATPAQMVRLQRSSLHYLQRPDLKAAGVDSARTSLNGFAGRVALNKQRGNVIFNTAFGAIDPYFDVNDLGFQFNGGGYANAHVFTGYAGRQPNRWSRSRFVGGAYARSWDWDRVPMASFAFLTAEMQTLGYWHFSGTFVQSQAVQNVRATRGGPRMLNPPGTSANANVRSDARRAVRVGANAGVERSRSEQSWYAGLDATWQPAPALNLSVGPNVSRTLNAAQYVAAFDDATAGATYGRRYVFAELDQWTLAADVRLNWTFTPKMSLQLFAQPLVASGGYAGFKAFERPRTFDFAEYGAAGASTIEPILSTCEGVDDEGNTPECRSTVRAYRLDADGAAGAAPVLEVRNPDFAVASLRGNAVFRWEYRPGSTFFLVWTQLLNDDDNLEGGVFRPFRSTRRLFDRTPENAFLLKLTYWLGR